MNQQLVDKLARTPLIYILLISAALTVYRLVVFRYQLKTPKHLRKSGSFRVLSGVGDLFDSLIYAGIFIFLVIRPFFFQTFVIPSGSMLPTLRVGDYIVLNKLIYRYTEPKRGDIVVFRPPAYACTPEQLLPDGTVNSDFVKRLIGLSQEKVEIRQGQMFVNDKPLYEPYKQLTDGNDTPSYPFRLLTDAEKEAFPKANWKLVKYKGELIPLNYTEYDANSPVPRSMTGNAPYSTVPKYVLNDPALMDELKKLPAEPIPADHYLFMGDNRNGSSDGRAWGLIEKRSVVGRADVIWLPFGRIGKPKISDNGTQPLPNAVFADDFKK
jgi:signal peptidase I